MTEVTIRHIVNALLVRGNKVLLARRSPGRRAYPGLWSFPGGHVEHDETLEQALVREAREEIGVVPVSFATFADIADPNADPAAPVRYHMYVVNRWDGGEPTIMDDEHTELRWFHPAAALDLTDLALEEYRPLLEEVSRQWTG